MPVEMILGRSKSGKSRLIYEKIDNAVKSGDQVILIVPEQYTHAAERKLLEKIGAIKDDGAEVLSFMRLASVTEKRLGICSKEKIDSAGKALIVNNILKKGSFKYFKSICSRNGFADLCVQTIGEFKKYMLSPDDLNAMATNADDEALALKLEDLSRIYDEYENSICEKYSDCDDVLTALANQISQSNIFINKKIFIDEFSTFVPQELNVISQLSRKCKSVCISLCCDKSEKNDMLFMPAADTISSVKSAINQDIKITRLDKTHFNSEQLCHLEKNLYKFPAKKYTKEYTDISIFSAANPYDETELVAANIMHLVRESGFRFGDIGVVCPDISSYAGHMERLFNAYNIPYFIDEKSDVLNHHIIRYILSFFDVYLNDYSYESIFNYLKTAFTNAKPEDICILENYIVKTGIRKNSWLDDERWNSLICGVYGDDDNIKGIINNIRQSCILPLAKMHEKIKGRHSVVDMLSVLYEFLDTVKLQNTLEKYISKFEAEGEIRLKKEYEQIWQIVTESLERIRLVCKDMTVNVSEFRNLLYTAFSQYSMGFIPSSVDGVLIGNTERTRTDGIKVLFVMGVNEGVFPIAPKPDGILSDNDKEKINDTGIKFSTTSTIAAYYSEFAAYTVFSMPSDKLFVSYPKAANDFKPLRKSYIITRICNIMSITENSNSQLDIYDKISSPAMSRRYVADAMAEYTKSGNIDTFWKNVYMYFKSHDDFADKLYDFANAVNIPQKINSDRLALLTGNSVYTSVSRIQKYMACRYSYFMDYVLNVNEKKESAVDSLDIGNITHSVIEMLCKKIEQSGLGFGGVSDEFIAEEIDKMLDEFVREFSKSNDSFGKRSIHIIKRIKGSAFMCMKAIQNHIVNSMFEPLGYEMEFKDGSDLGCIEIKLDNGKTAKLTGKIDRADIYHSKEGDFVRVTDYKTGSKTFKLDDVFYGLDVQLAVYLNALVDGNSNYKHGGALYFLIDDPIVSDKKKLSDEEIGKKLEKALKLSGMISDNPVLADGSDKQTASIRNKYSQKNFELMNEYLNNMLKSVCTDMCNGDISINPYKKGGKSPCDYCKYISVCRFDTTEKNSNYNYLQLLDKAEEIWQRMEAKLNVDR